MKLFSLAISDNKEIKFTGDLTVQEVKQIIEAMLYQQAFEAGRKSQREVSNGKSKSTSKKDKEGGLPESSEDK